MIGLTVLTAVRFNHWTPRESQLQRRQSNWPAAFLPRGPRWRCSGRSWSRTESARRARSRRTWSRLRMKVRVNLVRSRLICIWRQCENEMKGEMICIWRQCNSQVGGLSRDLAMSTMLGMTVLTPFPLPSTLATRRGILYLGTNGMNHFICLETCP